MKTKALRRASRFEGMFVETIVLTFSLVFAAAFVPWPADRQTRPTSPTRTQSIFAAKATEYMRERARVTGFSGVVLVAREGQPIFRGSYGMANHEFSIPNTATTRFRVGSVSKQFTSTAVLLLAQRGKLELNDPVSKFLPDWPKAWGAVTIHHLLSHTAGLPAITTEALLDVSALSQATPKPFREVRDLFRPGEELKPLDFTPGLKWNYSNAGYMVLSMVVEKVSGKSYCDFVSSEMFRPLGMNSTACEDPGVIVKQRASGYVRADGSLANAPYVDARFVNGTGSIYSTLDDLLLWNRVLDSNRLLTQTTTGKLFTPVSNGYGYGWWVQTRFNRKVEWHGGNISGFASQITRYPRAHLFIVVLSNVLSGADRSQVRAISNELAAMAFAESYEIPRKHIETKLDPATYDAYVGEYFGKDTFAIAREGTRLVVQFPPGQTVFEIVPESPTQFFWKGREYYLTFVKDEKDRVTRALVRNEGEIGRWTKSR